MKKIRNLLIFTVALFVPLLVFAADADANNWKLYCDEVSIVEGSTTKCYLLAQVRNADAGGKNITAVLTSMKGRKLFVKGYYGAVSSTTATLTNHGDPFNNGIEHSSNVCNGALGCYDFTSTAIESNTTLAVSSVTENNGYTPIGYWEVALDEQQITADSDDCGRICLDVDYVIGTSRSSALTADIENNNNGACQDIHLISSKVCRIENGIYYGKDGQQVTEEEFKKVCTRRIENGKYYDNNGSEVTKEVYENKCTCRIDGDKYYDATGQEVTKEVYDSKCTCRVSNGVYYGKDGSVITKEQYDADCVPKTGSFASYAVLAAGALIALSAITVAKKHNKFYRV